MAYPETTFSVSPKLIRWPLSAVRFRCPKLCGVRNFFGDFLSDSLSSIQQIDDPWACDPIGSVKYRHDPEPLPINDQHRSRGHPYWPPIPTRMNIRVNLQLPWAIPFASRYVTNTRGEIYCIPVYEKFVHHASYLVTGFVLFSRFCVPASPWSNHKVSGQTMMDTVTPRGPRDISPSSEEQIPILSYQVTWHTFSWTRKPP